MRLTSVDGTELALAVDRYQFPSTPGVGRQDWDANWLIVSGELSLPDGRRHGFCDPCLTTWEADDLRMWLDGLASGRDREQGDGPTLVFTEPCLAFAATMVDETRVDLRVYLSLEAEPPFVVAGATGMFENYVPVRTDAFALGLAAASWAEEIRRFPVRGLK